VSGGHHHGHAGGRHRWRLAAAFVLVAVFFVVELVAALWADSLALLSDAGHMAADVVALGAALAATRIATRRDTTGRRTYGSYRAEVFASGLTVLVMLGTAAYVGYEAVQRMGRDVEVATGAMVLVGALGLGVNVVALLLLRGGAEESLNVKGAYLEVLADTLGSVGVIAAGVLVSVTGDGWWDTVVAIAIAVFVAVRAVFLGREVVAVLGQHAPQEMDPAEVASALCAVDGVGSIHDLHLWTLTSGMNVATAHLVAHGQADPAEVLAGAQAVMRDGFGIVHATLQVEGEGEAADCREMTW
jgi:cobalt-zinc-cadmium efflux system protein